MGSKNTSEPPDYEQLMRQGFELQREFAPKYARQEYQLRQKFDPKLIREQQGLQGKFGPRQYQQQLQALQQLDPLGWYARQKLGRDSLRDLSRGYIDPRQEALYSLMAGQTRGELARGRGLSPEMQRETEQALRAGQSARGNIYGNAPLSAEALYKGARGQQMYQQRLQNAQSVYQQQTGAEKARAQAGSFLSLATPEQRISNVQGVQAPRGFGYVNPQAGQQAAAFGLANYPNQAAQGSNNPWATALGIVGGITGAIGGSYVGIGPQAGGQLGSATGSALGGWIGSDQRLKSNIVKVGEHNGLDVVEFKYKGGRNWFRGVLAQQVKAKFPDAVGERNGFLTVCYDRIGLPMLKRCKHCEQFKALTDFNRTTGSIDGRRSECRTCSKEYAKSEKGRASKRLWEIKNPEKVRVKRRRGYLRNRVKQVARSQEWKRKNPEKARSQRQRCYAKRKSDSERMVKFRTRNRDYVAKRRENLSWKLLDRLRHRIWTVLKRATKSASTEILLGCSLDDFRIYIESRWEPEMSWANYGNKKGQWSLDHIMPCAIFDLSKPEHQRRCFHFSNMRPMWHVENLKKHKTIITNQFPLI